MNTGIPEPLPPSTARRSGTRAAAFIENLVVQRAESSGHHRKIVRVADSLVRGSRNLLQQQAIARELQDGSREEVGTPRRNQQACTPMLDQLRDAADRAGYRRNTLRHAFQQSIWQPLKVERRQDADIRLLEQSMLLRSGDRSEQLHALIQTILFHFHSQLPLNRAGAGDSQRDRYRFVLPSDDLHGVDQIENTLSDYETPDVRQAQTGTLRSNRSAPGQIRDLHRVHYAT